MFLYTASLIITKRVIPAKAGIQKGTGFRVKPGMTNYIRLMSSCIKHLILILLMMLVALNAGETSYAQHQKPTEYEVKAAYIYNFAKFVEWPDRPSHNASAAMTICLLGEDPFGPALSAIEGKTVGGKKIMIKQNSLSQNFGDCDILFISNSEEEDLAQILEALGDLSVLTIGDTKGFAQQGVMINFYIEEKRVRFEINPKSAVRAGLKISANLLRIAKIVGEP